MATKGARDSLMLSADQEADLREKFDGFDQDENKYLSVGELKDALEQVGIKIPGYQVRDLLQEHDVEKDGKISFEEFKMMYVKLNSKKNFGRLFKKQVKTRGDLETKGGTTEASSSGTTHSVRKEEQIAFANWINNKLGDDKDCAKLLPMAEDGADLYSKCQNGILLCKMVNQAVPETIDERTINKGEKMNVYLRHENHLLALNSAQAIGCNIVNIGVTDVEAGTVHLILGLLWQVIKIGLLNEVNLQHHPGLVNLLEEGETIEDLLKLSPEAILIRWVNFHLRNSGCGRQITNLTEDIKDSVVYFHLLKQIAPAEARVETSAETTPDFEQRADLMLNEADKIGCRQFVTPIDVVQGNSKLNLAFVANLFNTCPALDNVAGQEEIIVEETREERTYRNWMNSLGVSPFVYYMYSDLCSGLVLFQLYDICKPGIVDWSRVQKQFKATTKRFKQIENGNYCVELGQDCKFSLVGIGGTDIVDGNQTLTLALVWQLMRAYTLAILTGLNKDDKPIEEKQIVEWVNMKLKEAGKGHSLSSFNDSALSDSRLILELIDALQPGAVSASTVREAESDEDKLANAKYAISMARKIGCRVYALPEDIVESNPKMVMTIFACLMTKGYTLEKEREQREQREQEEDS